MDLSFYNLPCFSVLKFIIYEYPSMEYSTPFKIKVCCSQPLRDDNHFMALDCKNKDNNLHVQQHYDIRINLFKNFFCFVPVYMHQPTKRIIV